MDIRSELPEPPVPDPAQVRHEMAAVVWLMFFFVVIVLAVIVWAAATWLPEAAALNAGMITLVIAAVWKWGFEKKTTDNTDRHRYLWRGHTR